MDDFTQFQMKEYENISQAHFKTNEVLATFYRYFLLITAIPITTIGLALMNLSEGGIGDEGRILAHVIVGLSLVLLSMVGAAVITYIEGLRLDTILYARVVNSIRSYFFNKPGAEQFGKSVLPTEKDRPAYGGSGASNIIYHACATMNSVYFAAGVFVLMIDRTVPLTALEVSVYEVIVAAVSFVSIMIVQGIIRCHLVEDKARKGF